MGMFQAVPSACSTKSSILSTHIFSFLSYFYTIRKYQYRTGDLTAFSVQYLVHPKGNQRRDVVRQHVRTYESGIIESHCSIFQTFYKMMAIRGMCDIKSRWSPNPPIQLSSTCYTEQKDCDHRSALYILHTMNGILALSAAASPRCDIFLGGVELT